MAGNSQELYTTAIIYGIVFVFFFLVFLACRNRFPRAFNPRLSVPALNCELASSKFASLDWIPGVCRFSDQDLFDQCGLDSVVFIRILQLGFKVSVVGCLNAIYLIPVYYYAVKTNDNAGVTDDLDRISIANMNNNDGGMYGTVAASYIVFGYTMYLVIQEFDWYISIRHQFMSRITPQNYTIFVGGIPVEMRSNKAIYSFFNQLFDDVYDVNIALRVDELDALTKKKETLEPKLEHAVNVFNATGKRPTHSDQMLLGKKKDSIDTFKEDLSKIEADISSIISRIEEDYSKYEASLAGVSTHLPGSETDADGPPVVRDGAFVTFRSLRSSSSAQLALYHASPFGLWVVDAPLPEHVCRDNVGLSHSAVQLGVLASTALTSALCVLWTIPVAVVASFSRVDSLKSILPFLQSANPLLDQVLAQVAPVALVVLIVVLPIILSIFARMEGHVAETAVRASLFGKLTLFKIVQIFFISAISGSIFDQLQELTENPGPVFHPILPSRTLTLTYLPLSLPLTHSLLISLTHSRSLILSLSHPLPLSCAA